MKTPFAGNSGTKQYGHESFQVCYVDDRSLTYQSMSFIGANHQGIFPRSLNI